jgi:PAS domain S-box-containing protein
VKANHKEDLTILHVEDETTTRSEFGRTLLRKYPNLSIYSAENGATGLTLFKELMPDITITDIHMPVMDGIQMARGIRIINPEAIIVAITTFSDTDYLLSAIEIGLNNYILKPINYSKLFAIVDKCIEGIILKKQLSNQNEHIRKLSHAVEECPCTIMITSREGFIEYVNPKFSEITGYSSEEVFGKSPNILKSGMTPQETYKQLWSSLISGLEWRGEFINRKKSGEIYWESASISPITDPQGAITHFVAVKEDITLRKQSEATINSLNESLQAYTRELQTANRELSSFNYMVTHDLRQPLTNISGFSQLIIQLHGDELSGDSRRWIQEIAEQTTKMKLLIETLLNFSSISHAVPERKSVNLTDLARAIASDFEKSDRDRTSIFYIADNLVTNGDLRLLRIVLENLLGNAWKYTRSRDQARIEFGTTTTDSITAFFVRDNGIGFDRAETNKLFIPFSRLEGTEEFAGHGIGLATVARIIKHHGGKIWAKGVKGVGAIFYFTLEDT